MGGVGSRSPGKGRLWSLVFPSIAPGCCVLSSGASSFCGQRWFEAGGLLEVGGIQPHFWPLICAAGGQLNQPWREEGFLSLVSSSQTQLLVA